MPFPPKLSNCKRLTATQFARTLPQRPLWAVDFGGDCGLQLVCWQSLRRGEVRMKQLTTLLLLLAACSSATVQQIDERPWRSSVDVLAQSAATDWRPLDPESTLYLETPTGQVVIELAAFAPAHVARIRALARLAPPLATAVVRVQENYVVQWAPTPEAPKLVAALPAEYTRTSADLPFFKLDDGDVYAPEVGWTLGLPTARDPQLGTAWLTHCYGMVGVGRDMPPDTGDGSELYVVSGHAPRHLDRNLAVVGRIVQGMELLTSLPRGTEALGFYAKPEQRAPFKSVRVAADVPQAERTQLEILRTDTQTWADFVAARRNRRETFFAVPTGRVELCNVAVPVRGKTAK